ncbi:hypothetical protein HII31_09065 [Pseudocercospora fuligena]|uniref:Uncharacterized protein n=1 Tax=Pseudocercospora fuligena TaxID=685502 RepID=A0A8H6RGG5_9PEZI|nr:hypothetical protein HII31_09065 [Pseudocercospora fuligena]
MKYYQDEIKTAQEESVQDQNAAAMVTDGIAQANDPYTTTYTPEEDHTLFYGRIFLTELRITPPVAADLSQPPQEYEHLLRFPPDQAVRLFDDADGNARWISADALYTHERVIQQDRVRLHPAADPIDTTLQRVESARNAGAQIHLEGVSSYLRDAPAIPRPSIADLLAEILENPAGHGMFADLVEDASNSEAGHPPVAPHFQAAQTNAAETRDPYSIADAVREGRRTNQRFNQQSVPSAAGLATSMVSQQTPASRSSLPSLPTNKTPLRQVSYASDVHMTATDPSSTRAVGHVSKPNAARQSSIGSSQKFGSCLPPTAVGTSQTRQQTLHSTPLARSNTPQSPSRARMSDPYPSPDAQPLQRQQSGWAISSNDTRPNEYSQAPRQMSRLTDVTDPDYEAIIYDSEPEI